MNIISDKISTFLGKFVDNFGPEQIEIDLLSGKFELRDLNLCPEKINPIINKTSPLLFKAGIIENISLKINIYDLTDIKILISGIFLIFSPKTDFIRNHKTFYKSS